MWVLLMHTYIQSTGRRHRVCNRLQHHADSQGVCGNIMGIMS